MIKPEECESLNEIRDYIDQIDKTIIDQLQLRSTFVRSAAKFKKSVSEVKASGRVKSMMAERRQWALKAGINPDFIQSLFEQIVSFFINGEKVQWMKENAADDLIITEASIEDIREVLSLQKRAFIQEAEIAGNDYNIMPIVQTLSEMEMDFQKHLILKACLNGQIIGSVRANLTNDVCYIGRLIVEPFFQNKGYGSSLMEVIESRFSQAKEYELFTGAFSKKNIQFYTKRGYKAVEHFVSSDGIELVKLRKTREIYSENR